MSDMGDDRDYPHPDRNVNEKLGIMGTVGHTAKRIANKLFVPIFCILWFALFCVAIGVVSYRCYNQFFGHPVPDPAPAPPIQNIGARDLGMGQLKIAPFRNFTSTSLAQASSTSIDDWGMANETGPCDDRVHSTLVASAVNTTLSIYVSVTSAVEGASFSGLAPSASAVGNITSIPGNATTTMTFTMTSVSVITATAVRTSFSNFTFTSAVLSSVSQETLIANMTATLTATNTVTESQAEATTVTMVDIVSSMVNKPADSTVTITVSPVPFMNSTVGSAEPASETLTEIVMITETIVTEYQTLIPSIYFANSTVTLNANSSALSTMSEFLTLTEIQTELITIPQISTASTQITNGTITFTSFVVTESVAAPVSITYNVSATGAETIMSATVTQTASMTKTQVISETTVLPRVYTAMVNGTVTVISSLILTEYPTIAPVANNSVTMELVQGLSTRTITLTDHETTTEVFGFTAAGSSTSTSAASTMPDNSTITMISSLIMTEFLTVTAAEHNATMAMAPTVTGTTIDMTVTDYAPVTLSTFVSSLTSSGSVSIPPSSVTQVESQVTTEVITEINTIMPAIPSWIGSTITTITLVLQETTIVDASSIDFVPTAFMTITYPAGAGITTTLNFGVGPELSVAPIVGSDTQLITITGTHIVVRTGTQTATATATVTVSADATTSPALTSDADAVTGSVITSSSLAAGAETVTLIGVSSIVITENGSFVSTAAPGATFTTETEIITIGAGASIVETFNETVTLIATEQATILPTTIVDTITSSSLAAGAETITLVELSTVVITENGSSVSTAAPGATFTTETETITVGAGASIVEAFNVTVTLIATEQATILASTAVDTFNVTVTLLATEQAGMLATSVGAATVLVTDTIVVTERNWVTSTANATTVGRTDIDLKTTTLVVVPATTAIGLPVPGYGAYNETAYVNATSNFSATAVGPPVPTWGFVSYTGIGSPVRPTSLGGFIVALVFAFFM